jgi:AAA+ superfamily predicted ATPase
MNDFLLPHDFDPTNPFPFGPRTFEERQRLDQLKRNTLARDSINESTNRLLRESDKMHDRLTQDIISNNVIGSSNTRRLLDQNAKSRFDARKEILQKAEDRKRRLK